MWSHAMYQRVARPCILHDVNDRTLLWRPSTTNAPRQNMKPSESNNLNIIIYNNLHILVLTRFTEEARPISGTRT
jgi:hypothetical protein